MKPSPAQQVDIEDSGALVSYLRRTERIAPDERPVTRVLAGGVSNRTVLVERANGDHWVLKQPLEKLRVPVDWYSPLERIETEAVGLACLEPLLPAGSVPRFLFFDPATHVLAMEAVPEPHANWKALLLAGTVDPAHFRQFGALLGRMHAGGSQVLDRLPQSLRNRSFFDSLRLDPYYRYTAQRVPAAADFLAGLIDGTLATSKTVVHGDYSPKNILVHAASLVLLDQEVIHIGDPGFDIGFSITHLLSKAHHLRQHRDAFRSGIEVYWQAYTADAAKVLDESSAVRHTLGCLLARVAGKSCLEYLTDAERATQRTAVLRLLADVPGTLPALVDRFLEEIEACPSSNI